MKKISYLVILFCLLSTTAYADTVIGKPHFDAYSTATQAKLNAKQNTLVSSTNIKTVNSTSLLGSGDLSVAETITTLQTTTGVNLGRGGGNFADNARYGLGALASNTTGEGNTAVGQNALAANTTGLINTAIGQNSLAANTTGLGNVGIGENTLTYNNGPYNTAIGESALYANTTGQENLAIGHGAASTQSTASYNVALGPSAMLNNVTGSNNLAIGQSTARELGGIQSAGAFNVGTSYTIQLPGTTNFTLIGAANSNAGTVFTATGVGTGTGTATPNTSGNTILGYNTGRTLLYGKSNTIIGANVTTAAGTSNNIILADGDGNQRAVWDSSGNLVNAGSVTAGTVIGGTGVTSAVTLQGTAGNGTATAIAAQVAVGNNGATKAVTVLNNGNVGIGTTAPVSKFHVGVDPTASANYGLVSLGGGAFDGSTTGKFAGSANGTLIAGNAVSGFAGDLINLQAGGTSKFSVTSTGNLTTAGTGYVGSTLNVSGNFGLGGIFSSSRAASTVGDQWAYYNDSAPKNNTSGQVNFIALHSYYNPLTTHKPRSPLNIVY